MILNNNWVKRVNETSNNNNNNNKYWSNDRRQTRFTTLLNHLKNFF